MNIATFVRITVGVAAATALAGPLFTDNASAARYKMYSCAIEGREPNGVGLWTTLNVPNSVGYDDCQGVSRAFGVRFPAITEMPTGGSAIWRITVPPTGARSSISIRRARVTYSADLRASSGLLYIGATGAPNVSIAGPGSFAAAWDSPELAAGTKQFDVYLYCGGGGSCQPVSTTPLVISGVELTLEESVAPSGRIVGGSLFAANAPPVMGERTASFEAADEESGVSRAELLFDSRVVAVRDLSTLGRCPATAWNACETSTGEDLVADTRQVPNGTYTAQLRVTDAAGNQRTVQASQPVVVSNGSGAGAGPAVAKIDARFAGRKRATILKNWSSTALVNGQLTTPAGAPIGNAEVKVTEITSGTRAVGRPAVRTRANGRFSYRVAGRQSSRRVRFQYGVAGAAPVAKDVRVRVRSASRLSARLSGVTVRYSGRVLSTPLPRKGKIVYVQGRAKGASWQTFATRRATRKSGRIRGRYRLRVRRPGVRLQFRMVVPSESGYPFEASTSPVVTKRVR